MNARWWTTLAIRSLLDRRVAAVLTLSTIMLGACLLLGVERMRAQARESFSSAVSGTDLIVGARTSPVGLLLYSVFHIGEPTSNVSWDSYQRIRAMPGVAWAVPLSLGDSHRGYRVVGTSRDFLRHYRYAGRQPLALAEGVAFDGVHEAVIGAEVARVLGYPVGQRIVLAHGTARHNLHQHDDAPFTVVGILAPTGTPVDASVLTSLESIEAIHADWQTGTRIPGARPTVRDEATLQPRSITAVLVGLERRAASFQLQRAINDDPGEPLLAILPGVALQQLWRLVGGFERVLAVVSMAVLAVGLIGMTTALTATLEERRREMAILRALGARPAQIAGLLVLESTVLTVVGAVAGAVLLQVATVAGRSWLLGRYGVVVPVAWPGIDDLRLLAWVLAAGLGAGLVPAAMAYRRTLADGLTPRL
ncbi:ABC transporter permease [Luteimonas sp. FCS-9]|uniref:ABC transporter permease n=1 Tax=Luteimonas sp. FCS-9 TaxID=1547516 RepID=UPI00063EA8D5|nr:ABC transporter permease [Luteimonas sp. FCS-9]KLJ00766.1 peptide ABC transporter permease [Luteimonas sp. FCS-9]